MEILIVLLTIIFVVCCFAYMSRSEDKRNNNENEILNSLHSDGLVHCPRCGCTQIQMVNRKWDVVHGCLTRKIDRVCLNCKHRF